MTERHGDRPDTPIDEPAPTMRANARDAEWVMTGNHTIAGGPKAERSLDEPAMTVGTRADLWVVDRRTNSRGPGGVQVPTVMVPMDRPAPTLAQAEKWIFRTRRDGPGWVEEHGERQDRTIDEPANTITGEAHRWGFERPATTVQGDPRLGNPGHRDREGGEPQFGPDALRLSVPDALRLQSFPADYPVQGSKSKQFEQVGNAVPPLLARHILSRLISAGALGEETDG